MGVAFSSSALGSNGGSEESRAKARAEFPDLSNAESVFAKAYAAEEAELRGAQQAFFANSNWPLMLAYRVATKLGLSGDSATSNEDPDADADLVRGQQLYTIGDFKGAFNHYSRAAARGVPAAQRLLAQMWGIGRGTPRAAADKMKARQLLTEAANNGDRVAQEILATEENARVAQEQAFQEMRAKAFAPRLRKTDRVQMERAVWGAGLVRHRYDARKLSDAELIDLHQQALPILELQQTKRAADAARSEATRARQEAERALQEAQRARSGW